MKIKSQFNKETKQVVAANRLVEKMQAEAYVQLLLDTKQKHRDTELI
jgi:roadblock/LC7 domain-containing protein